VQGLQLEIEKHREMYFNVRRDFEILKTEHEQMIVNHVRRQYLDNYIDKHLRRIFGSIYIYRLIGLFFIVYM
jgi:hypothetical protein